MALWRVLDKIKQARRQAPATNRHNATKKQERQLKIGVRAQAFRKTSIVEL